MTYGDSIELSSGLFVDLFVWYFSSLDVDIDALSPDELKLCYSFFVIAIYRLCKRIGHLISSFRECELEHEQI